MVGDQRRPFSHHQGETGVGDRVPVERAELAAVQPLASAEAILASEEQRQAFLHLILVGRQKAGHPAVMVEMAVAQHQGVDASRIDAKDRQIIEQRLGRVSEIDEDIARFVAASGLRVHGKTPFRLERPARWPVRRCVEARALDLEPIERPRRRERRQPIIDHHANGQPIDSRDGGKRVGASRSAGPNHEKRERGNETSAAALQHAAAGQAQIGAAWAGIENAPKIPSDGSGPNTETIAWIAPADKQNGRTTRDRRNAQDDPAAVRAGP